MTAPGFGSRGGLPLLLLLLLLLPPRLLVSAFSLPPAKRPRGIAGSVSTHGGALQAVSLQEAYAGAAVAAVAAPSVLSKGLAVSTAGWEEFALRASFAALAATHLAPEMQRQLEEASSAKTGALRAFPWNAKRARKWLGLVRFKAASEVAGLAVLLGSCGSPAFPHAFPLESSVKLSSLAVVIMLTGHALFWILGGGGARLTAKGDAAAVSPKAVRVLLGADIVLLGIATLPLLAPGTAVGSVGAGLFTAAAGALALASFQKMLRRRK